VLDDFSRFIVAWQLCATHFEDQHARLTAKSAA
jgi:hypothetical protein